MIASSGGGVNGEREIGSSLFFARLQGGAAACKKGVRRCKKSGRCGVKIG